MMGFIYAGLWFVVALVLLLRFRQESKAVLPLSVYFFFLGIWWAADEVLAIDLMHTSFVWIVRSVSIVMLLYCGAIYYLERTGRIEKKVRGESSIEGGEEETEDAESDV